MESRLQIVTVNWNAGEQLRRCLKSITSADKSGFKLSQVVVVDNASTDGSADALEDIDLPVKILHNRQNRGFAAACNQGAKISSSDYLLFLNPDTVLSRNALEDSIRFLQQPGKYGYGICGIQLVSDNGIISRSCARFPTVKTMMVHSLGLNRLNPNCFKSYLMEAWPHNMSEDVNHVIGAFFLVRRSLFKMLGGFDERFFLYLEDLDFSNRAHDIGFKTHYLASTKAYHKGGGTSEKVKGPRLFYSLRSRILYVNKYFPPLSAMIVIVTTVFLEPLIRFTRALMSHSPAAIGGVLRAYYMLWRAIPEIVRSLTRR